MTEWKAGPVIYSTRDHAAECMISWRGREWIASADDVIATAEDLFTCAAWADLYGELLNVGLPGDAVTQLMHAMLVKRPVHYFGRPGTIFMTPGANSKKREGRVAINTANKFVKNGDDALTPDEARKMGRDWIETATASAHDSAFYSLMSNANWLPESDLEALFGLLRDISLGEEERPPSKPRPSGSPFGL